MANRIVNQLVKKYGKVMAFKDLPLGFKLSMVHYMAVDGEAWELCPAAFTRTGAYRRLGANLNQILADNISFYDERYGHLKFVIAMVPKAEYCKSLMANFKKNDDMKHLSTVDGFLKEYEQGGPVVNHKDASWPVILSGFPEELIQDGWHRQHCYLNKGFPVIPCIGYLPKVKYY